MTIPADKATFDTHIQDPCVVDFYTSGCPSCEKFGPVFEQAASLYAGYKFVTVNLDEDITLAERYGITHVPTAIRFVGRKAVNTVTGYMDSAAFGRFMEEEEGEAT